MTHLPATISLRARLLDAALRVFVKRRLRQQPLTDAALARWRRRFDRLGLLPCPRSVVRVRNELAGVAAEWTSVTGHRQSGRVIFYLHGGAYLVGSAMAYRDFIWRLAAATGARVVAIDYRLAPEHPFPAASDDALAAYTALVAGGTSPSTLTIAGDSAGGNLALVTLLRVRDAGLPLPAAAVLLSPWTDLTGRARAHTDNAVADAMLPAERLGEVVAAYAPRRDPTLPLLSPLCADLRGLPPMLIHGSDHEILRDDAHGLAERVMACGGRATYREWHAMPHAFAAFARFLPEARRALTEIGEFVSAESCAPPAIRPAPGLDRNCDPGCADRTTSVLPKL